MKTSGTPISGEPVFRHLNGWPVDIPLYVRQQVQEIERDRMYRRERWVTVAEPYRSDGLRPYRNCPEGLFPYLWRVWFKGEFDVVEMRVRGSLTVRIYGDRHTTHTFQIVGVVSDGMDEGG